MMEHSNVILARAEHLIFLLILKLQHVFHQEVTSDMAGNHV